MQWKVCIYFLDSFTCCFYFKTVCLECAKKGSILLPIKDIEMHAFITQVADAAIGGDVWIGLRARTWSLFYDNDDTLLQPLQETITDDLSYSDGEPFDPEINYKMG